MVRQIIYFLTVYVHAFLVRFREEILMNSLWDEISLKVIDGIYVKAVESSSPE